MFEKLEVRILGRDKNDMYVTEKIIKKLFFFLLDFIGLCHKNIGLDRILKNFRACTLKTHAY